MNPTNNPVSKKQQHQKKRSDVGHFGRNTCDFAIFYKRKSQGRINRRRFYRTKARGFIINKIKLRREAKINKGDRVCRNKLNITRAEKFIKKKSNSSGSLTCFSNEESKDSTKTNIIKGEGLLSKLGLDLITTEKEGQTVSKTQGRLHPKGGNHPR